MSPRQKPILAPRYSIVSSAARSKMCACQDQQNSDLLIGRYFKHAEHIPACLHYSADEGVDAT